MRASAAVCPECAVGKCVNCDGQTWDVQADDFTECTCEHDGEQLGLL